MSRAAFFAEVHDPAAEFLLHADSRLPPGSEEHYSRAFALRAPDACPRFLAPLRPYILRTLQAPTRAPRAPRAPPRAAAAARHRPPRAAVLAGAVQPAE